MSSIKMFKKSQSLFAAIVAVSAISAAEAKVVDVVLLGHANNQLTDIQNLPNVGGTFDNPSNLPAGWQIPRLSAFAAPGQGSGWPAELELSIDLSADAVVDFKMSLTGNQYFSANTRQGDVRVAGRNYTPGADFNGCTVVNGLATADNVIEINCQVLPADGVGRSWIVLSSPGYQCMTPEPLNTAIGGNNGCGRGWGTDPATIIAAASPAVSVIGVDASFNPQWGGWKDFPEEVGGAVVATNTTATWALAGTNLEQFTTGDAAQEARGRGLHEFQGVRAGGFFTITHDGTDEATFAITGVSYQHDTSIEFNNGFPLTPGKAQSFTSFTFDHVVSQSDNTTFVSGKNVPAMGAFGLAALFGGLVAVAARLRRRVS